MNKEEIKCLNDCGFANVTQLLLAFVALKQENQQLKDNWNELKKFAEEKIIECKAIINKTLPELEEIIPSINGKSSLTNEYNNQQTIIKCFEVVLSKMQELGWDNE